MWNNEIILNTVKEKCKGVWTRVQGEEKSIIDYVLTDASSANTVKEMKIDEEKQYGLHKLDKNTATNKNRKIYSDHNSILINLDFETSQVNFFSDIRIYIHKKNTIFNNRNKHRNKNNCNSSNQKWAKVFSNVRG